MLRAIAPVAPALTQEEAEESGQLADELDELESAADDDLDAESHERIAAIKSRLAELNAKSAVYSDEQKAKSGAFVSIDNDGALLVKRGYRRHADILAETKACPAPAGGEGDFAPANEGDGAMNGDPLAAPADDDSCELADKLMTELTAYHSLGLRNALAADHGIAYLAVLHALILKLFYRGHTTDSCLQIATHDTLVTAFPGLAEFKAAREIAARHEAFEKMLPERNTALWDFLLGIDESTQQLLFAHCAGLSVNAVHEPAARSSNKRRHAGQLAEALQLDMGAQGFVATAANYLGRVKKQQILETVAEAKDEETAGLLADLKKKDMAAEAERLLADAGWLPQPLRTTAFAGEEEGQGSPLPAFLDEEDATLQAAE